MSSAPDAVFISICIPTYKQPALLHRLLDSIALQAYRDFEVIVSDDTPGTDVEEACREYANQFKLVYHKNTVALGTPANWNKAISLASGEWIKLMHHDDWFASAKSLEQFAAAVKAHPAAGFFFSAYANVFDDDAPAKHVRLSGMSNRSVSLSPAAVLSSNFIGPPSVTMYRRHRDVQYDENLKWLVDIDFYIRYCEHGKSVYINDPLVCIGVHSAQVTAGAFRNPQVEVPEYLYLLHKHGEKLMRPVMGFDAYWRMLRNLRIRDIAAIRQAGFQGKIPAVIGRMIKFQRLVPSSLLRIGLFSKLWMFACYLYSKTRKNPQTF